MPSAEIAYLEALRLTGPATANIYLQLGHLAKAQGRPVAAASFYRTALELDRDLYEAATELRALAAGKTDVGWGKAASESGVSRDAILAAYEMLLARLPDERTDMDSLMRLPDWPALVRHILASPEFTGAQPKPSPPPAPAPPTHEHQVYTGYMPGELALFENFPRYTGPGSPGFVTNFLGIKVRTKFAMRLPALDGKVLGYPMPVGGLGGETAEFIGAMRSVLEARQTYTMLECGAGYGTWMVMTATMARKRGISNVKLYGIEADGGHIDFLYEHLADNHIDPSVCTVIHGAIGAEAGIARWAIPEDPAKVYGGRPMADDLTDYFGKVHDKCVEVRIHALRDLLDREPRWDFVHIDIQGGEGELCRKGIEVLTDRVKRVFVGTHSRALDGEVMSIFHTAGWILENEKPTLMGRGNRPKTLESLARVDGVQVWRNPLLAEQLAG